MMSRRACLAQLAAAPTIGACGVEADAELRALGGRLWRRWAIERAHIAAEDWEAYEPGVSMALARAMLAIPATTLPGLGVKALAAVWCHNGELFVENYDESLDVLLLDDLVRDLLRLTGWRFP